MPTKSKPINRALHELDAKDMILGRLATQAATLLRGKHKVEFEQNIDSGDFVTIVNAKDVKVTGNKLTQKIYYRHSGYIGSLKETALATLMEKAPEKVIKKAIYGMLPKNRLRALWMRRLKVYAGDKK